MKKAINLNDPNLNVVLVATLGGQMHAFEPSFVLRAVRFLLSYETSIDRCADPEPTEGRNTSPENLACEQELKFLATAHPETLLDVARLGKKVGGILTRVRNQNRTLTTVEQRQIEMWLERFDGRQPLRFRSRLIENLIKITERPETDDSLKVSIESFIGKFPSLAQPTD